MTMKKTVILVVIVCATSVFAWKKEAHYISMPIIEGAGLYTSIRCLQDTKSASTQIPSITTIVLLAGNAGLGALTVFGPQDNYPLLRTIHRYVGMAVSAAALWMTIAAANDRDVNNLTRNISYGYTAVTTVPIIIFSF
jgi:heme A synthase